MNEIRTFALTTALELDYINRSKMSSAIIRTKDPTIAAMESDVLSKLAEYSKDNISVPAVKNRLPSDNKVLSPEEAAKELAEMQVKGLI